MSIDYLEQRRDARECIKQVKAQTFGLAGVPFGFAMLQDQYPGLLPDSAIDIPSTALLIIAAIFLCGGLIRIEIIRSDFRRIVAMMHDTERREGLKYDPDRNHHQWCPDEP